MKTAAIVVLLLALIYVVGDYDYILFGIRDPGRPLTEYEQAQLEDMTDRWGCIGKIGLAKLNAQVAELKSENRRLEAIARMLDGESRPIVGATNQHRN